MMKMENQLPLEYVMREPLKKARRSPVIFMLHGYGSNEKDLFSFADELPEEYAIISIRAPYELSTFGYAWFSLYFDIENTPHADNEEAIKSRDLIMHFIEEACKLHKLDAKNVTLIGFSQGSILSMAIAISYPRKIRNVIALSGYLNMDILKESYKKQKHFPINFYVSHGTSDQIIPIDWARKIPEFLKKIKADFVYEEFPVGHGVAPQNFYSFREWLKKRSAADN